MPRVSTTQNAFDGGELSSRMVSRSDLDRYKSSLFASLNGLGTEQGSWVRRPGFAHLNATKYPDNKATRLVPFQYSTTQTYILEFGHLYVRFYSNHGIVTKTPQSITSISKANPGVITKVAHGYTGFTPLLFSGFSGMPQLENRTLIGHRTDNDHLEIQEWGSKGLTTTNLDTTNYDAFVSGQMAEVLELQTTYTADMLPQLRFVQSADVLYITHPDVLPSQLVRTAALSWSLNGITFTDGPYDAVNTTTTTITPSAATGNVTLTLSATTGVNNGQGWLITDVGRLVRMQEGTTWGYAVITTFSSSTLVSATVLSTLTNTNAKASWRLGIYSTTTGFPSVAAFYEDRLYFGNTPLFPQRFDGSRVSLYTNFSPSALDGTVSDSHAVSGALNAQDVNAIYWMMPTDRAFLMGTAGAEWEVKATTLGAPITPSSITYRPVTTRGSFNTPAISSGRATLFVQKAARKLREFVYAFDVDGYKTPDMSQLASHITAPSLQELARQNTPHSIIWARRGDGVLLSMLYDRDANSIGWHRHELGGQSSQDGINFDVPLVNSLAVVSAPDGTRDELYAIAERYVNGKEHEYIGYMSSFWEEGDDQATAFHMDAGFTQIDTPATNTIHGIWHLEGETVPVFVDGAVHPDVTVSGGKAVLNYAGIIKTIGYTYNSDGMTLPSSDGSQNGSGIGKLKRFPRVGFWLLDTLGLSVGRDFDNLTELTNDNFGDQLGSPPALFNGIVRDSFNSDFDRAPQIAWRNDGPFPTTLLAVMADVEESDDS